MSRDISTLSIIITGGARGIGRATAERFARQGARVGIGVRDGGPGRVVAPEVGPVIREAPGDHIFERFVEAKTEEWDEYRKQVSGWEVERYHEAF